MPEKLYKEIRVYSLDIAAMNITITKVLYKVELSEEYQCVIIGTTHLYIKFNIFRAKKLLSLSDSTRMVCSNRDNFFHIFSCFVAL